MTDPYDSTQDTTSHINTVRLFLGVVIRQFEIRQEEHDASKLLPPEKEMYDVFTPRLKETTYGSDEYKASLLAMGPALSHHYENNTHHPEHFGNGVNGMSLLDLIEMLADWKAASLRHADGNLVESLRINIERFHISPQLAEILQNTISEMEWK